MQPNQRDASYIWDIVHASRDAIEIGRELAAPPYASGRERTARLAVERCIEIIGEAARRLSEDFRNAHPEVPWQKIIGQRNVLAHDYRDIQHDKIFAIVTVELPGLVATLEALLPPPPGSNEDS